MTSAGNDLGSVRLSVRTVDLCREFQEEAHSVALHPTALFVLVGFSDKLRLMSVLVNDVRLFKEFTVRGCRQVSCPCACACT